MILTLHVLDLTSQQEIHSRIAAFRPEHRDYLLRAPVAEKLAEFLFVVGDLMLVDKGDEVR
jgi:hypothetical protein